MTSGPTSPTKAVSINDSYRFAYSQILFERGGKVGFCFLPPLAWLLYRMNSPSVPMPERDAAARAALPYCHEKVPEAVPGVSVVRKNTSCFS
jgi:hypothetical protein